MRTIVDIPDEQLTPLSEMCRLQQISRAEAIRQALALYLEKHAGTVDSAFGLWQGRGQDGVTYQRSIRQEWDE